jgi:hypothetical protein
VIPNCHKRSNLQDHKTGNQNYVDQKPQSKVVHTKELFCKNSDRCCCLKLLKPIFSSIGFLDIILSSTPSRSNAHLEIFKDCKQKNCSAKLGKHSV